MRNAEFDRETVLRSAMLAFMRKGYSKTSMQDLTQATGLHPGSIYCAFTNKRGLMLAALAQYQQDRSASLQQIFADPSRPAANLQTYLNQIVAECLSCDAAQACLLVKAMNELAEQDDDIRAVITQNLLDWQLALAKVFAQAKALKQIVSDTDDTTLAQYFIMGIYGLRTFAHTHPDAKVLHALADKLYRDVCQTEL